MGRKSGFERGALSPRFVFAFGSGACLKKDACFADCFAKLRFAFYKTCAHFARGRIRRENSCDGLKKAFNAAEMD